MKNNLAGICDIPNQLDRQNNQSLRQLLKALNINRKDPKISIDEIKDYLEKKSNLIESWLLYSMDKRVSEGWFFIKLEKAKYIVGYLFKNSSKKEFKYSDPAHACAVFIYNELFETDPNRGG